ncbi:MAG: pyruvate kinase [Candidatus Andersenbacteria bacterium]
MARLLPSLAQRTKIVCTIGPASATSETLVKMITAGMDVARLNFSHGSYDSNLALLEKVRTAADKVGRPVGILLDLQGPKIRVGRLPDEGLELIAGQMATLHAGVVEAAHGAIPVPYDRLAHDVGRGDRILLDDGTRELEVLDVQGPIIRTKVLLGGRLLSHKGINVPTVGLSIESLTPKDDQDLQFGLKQDIDFVALSFVRSAQDVQQLRDKITQYLPAGTAPPAIIVKIEKHEALANFDEILAVTDGVMIARGDLGLETSATQVPMRQKELIAKCIVASKPVITATQMLDSMQRSPRPTRAEISDVANAVIDHTDAVMLSGETAMGHYPVPAVTTMAQIISDTEESPLDDLLPHRDAIGEPIPSAVAAAAVELARHINAATILVTTHSGYSARVIARYRPATTIFAVTDSVRTQQKLLLTWGVVPFTLEGYEDPEQMSAKALEHLRQHYRVPAGSTIVVVAGLKRAKGSFDSAVRVVEL